MQGAVYRNHIFKIVRTVLNSHLGERIPKATKKMICFQTAAMVHARLYGTEVDGTVSPIWRDLWAKIDPKFNAQMSMSEILNEAEMEMKE